MISVEDKGKLNSVAAIISSYMDLVYPKKDFEFFEMENVIQDIMSGPLQAACSKLTKEEREYIVNLIRQNKPFHFADITGIVEDNNRKWFTDDKERENNYFDRYVRYLKKEKGFKDETTRDLSEKVLNPIMNQLGNPKAEEFSTHGLVMGDVQSGKTMTYIGLINKAVDAGYKLIVILTGTIESLRKQTQDRVDVGFTGFDSDSAVHK